MPEQTPEALEAPSFRFRSGNASIKGGIGGAVLVGAALGWATLTGRIHDADLTYFAGWILGGLLMAALLWRGHRVSVRRADGPPGRRAHRGVPDDPRSPPSRMMQT